ncbi:hypothetical protein F4V57_08430 [Acinetobacter qingfengensis]|uniref:FimV domain-containing protein n=1 Tax=Acinetobacter qingfengensis TaxID=1262585 RepID=A0A1E7R1C6_9GAMM|nr:hypothetical protein [Acinetobacter qingfengensis]KAA8733242.1 hypothetical protein F4V57_08430 [Acinetobacter qingfengensis]OEY93125.1 hypothetical protein BJI46_05130 [Acinetobacter qingfengensis]
MPTTIIIIAVIALAVLLVLRAKQNKSTHEPRNKTNLDKARLSKKTLSTNNSTKISKATPDQKEIELKQLVAKIDLHIANKDYSKAEGLINMALNQDYKQEDLYFKLLNIYHVQDDNFAIKQLLDTVEKLNLNELYQKLYNANTDYKEQQDHQPIAEKNYTVENINTTPFIPEDEIITTHPVSHNIDFSTDIKSENHFSTEPVKNTYIAEDALEFNLDGIELDHRSSKKATEAEELPTFNFELDQQKPSLPTSDPQDQSINLTQNQVVTEKPLEFNLSNTVAPVKSTTEDLTQSLNAKDSIKLSDHKAELNFDLEQKPTEQHTPEAELPAFTLNFDLSEPTATSIKSDQTLANTFSLLPNLTQSDQQLRNDPLLESFPELADINEVDLNLELAEHYIGLGAIDAAKQLITAQQHQLTQEQATRTQDLLQKIA